MVMTPCRLVLAIVYASLHSGFSSYSSSSSYDTFYSAWQFSDVSVRLVGGAVEREGRVELHGSISGTICSNGWTEDDADLLCELIGFEGVEEHLVYNFGEGTGDIWSNVGGCIEDFYSTDCNLVNSTTDPLCTHSKDVGIMCLPLRFRLVGEDLHEGRAEFYYFGQWSTMSGLNLNEAHIICHHLGYPAAEFSDCCGIFGITFGMSSYVVNCIGSEKEIADCNIYRTYNTDRQSGLSCTRDGVRLTDGNFESEGLLEIYTDSGWHKVCTPDVNMEAARVICKQLNFDDIKNISDGSSNSTSPTIRNIICSGSESRFEECSFESVPNQMCKNGVYLSCEASGSRFIDGYSRNSGFAQTYIDNIWMYLCETTEDVFESICLQQQSTGVELIRPTHLDITDTCVNCTIQNGVLQCVSIVQYTYYDPIYYTECSKDTIRIQEGGHQGLVEIFRNNSWISVCQDQWNSQAAEIACRELQFIGVSEVSQPQSDPAPRPNATVVRCEGSESSLLHCRFDDTVQCRSHAVHVTCLDVGIRFEGSVVDYAGRVEIYTDNEWGTVCDDYWDTADANVACIMAGYPGAITSYSEAAFGEGVGSILANNLLCDGDETRLLDCPYDVPYGGYCGHYEDAGLICSTDVIRLSDGSSSAGRVELFVNGKWGTVCDDNWDTDDASVVCRQLGFDGASDYYGNGRYGSGEGPIHLDEVQCTGNESGLLQCDSKMTHDCQHSEDAGVSCFSGCYDYWFRDSRICLTVVQLENSKDYTSFTDDTTCPHGSTFLKMDTSLELLKEYIRILYYYEPNVPNVFLWENADSRCTFMNRPNDTYIWREKRESCSNLKVSAYVCQMDIQEQTHSCSNNQFNCSSGACITKSLVCDGNFDCPDKSDENEEQCIQECFRMMDGSDYRGTNDKAEDGTHCLPWTSPFKGTDGIYPSDFVGKGIGNHNYCRNPNGECRPWCYSDDFYEVKDCAIPKCLPDSDRLCPTTSFKCESGHCISYTFYCDHKADCPDNSDEADCIFLNCSATEFACDNGRCLESSLRCNGIAECIDGTDELKCAECSESFLRCVDGTCLHPKYKCDGTSDCSNGIDEHNCPTGNIALPTPLCDVREMKCENGVCVDQRSVCILDYDVYGILLGCRDRSHLFNCAAFQCPAHMYKCPNSFCITIKSRCDGKNDCDNGEDEQYCDDYNCPGYFKCQDATNCISQDRVCNNIKDCVRGDDELFCNVTCPDGCTCNGLSFNCAGTEWTEDKGDLIPIDIRYLNLSGVSSHPTAVGSEDELLFINLSIFKFVTILDISGSSINAITNKHFDQMIHLKTLCIQDNMIRKLDGDVFKDLKNLNYLDIHGNGLKSIDRNAFAELAELEYLDISGNDIGEVDKNIFEDLRSLRRLISDEYAFCCLLNWNADVDCTPTADVFSSCENLMQNTVLRVFLWLFGWSALLGNMFVIAWRARNWPSKKSASYTQSLLITNLAVTDGLMGLYMLIIACADVYYRDEYVTHDKYWKGGFTCTLAGILAFLSSESSVCTLTLISCDRFLHIAFPFHRVHLTPKTVKYAVAAGWTMTLIMSIIPALPSSYFNNEFYGVTSVCLALPLTSERVRGWEYTAAIFIGFNMFCFLIIFLSYSGIFVLIKRSRSKVKQTSIINSVKNQHIAMAMRMAFIVATDFFCWVPIIVMGMLSLTRRVDIPAVVYAWAAVFILPINSAINPYLYTIASLKKLQKQLRPSKGVSHSMPQTDKSTVSVGASSPCDYQRKKEKPSVVEKIEAIVNAEIDTGNSEFDAEIYEYLSKALQLSKQVQASLLQVEVENDVQPIDVDTNHSSQADTRVRSTYVIDLHNPVFEADS